MSISTLIYIIIATVLLYLTFKKRKSNGGLFSPDMSGLTNIFFGIILVLFTLIYGGFVWW